MMDGGVRWWYSKFTGDINQISFVSSFQKRSKVLTNRQHNYLHRAVDDVLEPSSGPQASCLDRETTHTDILIHILL